MSDQESNALKAQARPTLGLAHIKEEGSDRCPSCGCQVKDFPYTTCNPPMRGNGDGT
jgi:hypothetical protein